MTDPGSGSDTRWRKSSHSGSTGDCVEVAVLRAGAVGVRDTKNRAHGALIISGPTWGAFVRMSKHIC
ncbi:MAG TPA: DUF397 domain-containing protein [Streptosporangiaceae bacterium]